MRRTERFSIGEQPRVDVDVPTGAVQVVPGDAGTITVTLDASAPDNYDIAHIGDTVTVRAPSGWLSRGGKVQLVVEVPDGTDVSVSTASGDVTSRAALGALRARTASGDVEVDRAARAEVHTASGDVRIGDVGEAQLSTASGDVRVRTVRDRLGASSASGDVDVERVAGGTAEVATTSGDVRMPRCEADDIAVKTVSGDVVLGLPSGIRVEPEISTLSGRTRLPTASAPGDAPRRTVRLRIRTVSGDIRIDRVTGG